MQGSTRLILLSQQREPPSQSTKAGERRFNPARLLTIRLKVRILFAEPNLSATDFLRLPVNSQQAPGSGRSEIVAIFREYLRRAAGDDLRGIRFARGRST
jgi:hypothetical protein